MSERKTDTAMIELGKSLVADLSPDTIKQMAEVQLKEAMNSWEVQETIKKALVEPINAALSHIIKSSDFNEILNTQVTQQTIALVAPACRDVLSKLAGALAKT